jgi:hypothetical protein
MPRAAHKKRKIRATRYTVCTVHTVPDRGKMEAEQNRKPDGKFGARSSGRHSAADGERMVDIVKFRVTTQVSRHLGIMFHQHREEFGWQVPSDMYRELLSNSLTEYDGKIKKPSPEMLEMKRRHEELDRMQAKAMRHADFDTEMEKIDRYVDMTMRAGDLDAVRSMLADFRMVTRLTTDAAIKGRREMEYDRRWKRLDEGINRNASFNPRAFVSEDDD